MSAPNFPVKNVYAGEVIFKEGAAVTPQMYIIREGKVEIFVTRDEKQVLLSTLERGAFFGEMALISDSPRSASAKAATFCELFVVDAKAVEGIVAGANPILRHMLKTLVGVVKNQNSVASRQAMDHPKVVAYGHLLEAVANETGQGKEETASLPDQKIIDRAKVFFGDSRSAVRAVLEYMDGLGLVKVSGNVVKTQPRTIVERTAKLPAVVAKGADDVVQSAQELIDLSDFQQLVDVDRSVLLRKLAFDELAEDLFVFRRSPLKRLLDEKGRDYFAKVQADPPPPPASAAAAPAASTSGSGGFETLQDVAVVPKPLLAEAVDALSVQDLANLLGGFMDDQVRECLLEALNPQKRIEVEALRQTLGTVDAQVAADIERALTERIADRLGG